MATVFLDQDESFVAANSDSRIFGRAGGEEAVEVQPGITGLTLDGNVEQIGLAAAAADVTFRINNSTGQLELVSDGGVVAAFGGGFAAPVGVRFSDGEAALTQTGATSYRLEDESGRAVTVSADSPQTGDAPATTPLDSDDGATVTVATQTLSPEEIERIRGMEDVAVLENNGGIPGSSLTASDFEAIDTFAVTASITGVDEAFRFDGIEAGDRLVVTESLYGGSGANGSPALRLRPATDTDSDSASIVLQGGLYLAGGNGGDTGDGAPAIDATSFETLNIESVGESANRLSGGGGGASNGESIRIATDGLIKATGDQYLSLNYVKTPGVDVDAAEMTGDLYVRTAGGENQLEGGAGNDTLIGGVGADVLTGGDGADRFIFAVGSEGVTGGTPNASTYERITDYDLGVDLISTLGFSDLAISPNPESAPGEAAIDATGLATFAESDTTLQGQIDAVAAALGSGADTSDGLVAIFEHEASTYVYLQGDTLGRSSADALIQLSGVTGVGEGTIDDMGGLTLS